MTGILLATAEQLACPVGARHASENSAAKPAAQTQRQRQTGGKASNATGRGPKAASNR
jgi:hypothetical protein